MHHSIRNSGMAAVTYAARAALEGNQGAHSVHGRRSGIGGQAGGWFAVGSLYATPTPSLHPLPPRTLTAHFPFPPCILPSPRMALPPAPPLRLVLHWKATKGRTIKMAVVASGAKAAGWFAVGFSPNGGMAGSNAIATDSSGSPVTKDLVGQSSADDASWTVGSGSISTSGSKVIMK
ncbi:unnamed protein product [Closterium sp. Naga37s-1]|nr:unnamed protein product [Closterium sp. Naga37s-1]